jgi:hypothetical protein
VRKANYSDEKKQESNLLSCFLDSCQFAAGAFVNSKDTVPPAPISIEELVDQLHDQGGKDLYTTHANFLTGNENKQSRMELNGHWLATQTSDGLWNGKCLSFESLGGPRGYYNSSNYKGVLPVPRKQNTSASRTRRHSILVNRQKNKPKIKKIARVKRSPNMYQRAANAGIMKN